MENLENCLSHESERRYKELPRGNIYLIEILHLCVISTLMIKILPSLYNPQYIHKSNSLSSRVFQFYLLRISNALQSNFLS